MNVTLRPIQPEEVARAEQATAAGGHSCLNPTHLMERDGQVVGYASVGAITFLTGWIAKEIPQPEAAQLLGAVEAQCPPGLVVMPCTADCRFVHDMKKLGWQRGSKTRLHFKLKG